MMRNLVNLKEEIFLIKKNYITERMIRLTVIKKKLFLNQYYYYYNTTLINSVGN